MVGHIDRKDLRDDAPARSWNSSHPSRGSEGAAAQPTCAAPAAMACSIASPVSKRLCQLCDGGRTLLAVGDLVHVETFFARNLGGLIHARTYLPGRLGKA